MRLITIVCSVFISAMAADSMACTLPKLAIIPAKDQVAGQEADVMAAMMEYSVGMDAYVACVRAELDAAGGDDAPDMIRRVLVSRNNVAVAEKEFMIRLYTENVGPAGPGVEPVPGAPPGR